MDGSFGSLITSANWKNAGWRLESGENTCGPFHSLLVTTPAAQAVPLLGDVPALAKRASSVTMAPCWALMLAFEKRLPTEYDGLFINEGPLAWSARNSSKPGRPPAESWVVHASPTWSKANLELQPEEALSELLPSFFDALRVESADPVFARAHRWRYALAENPLESECLVDTERNIAVAGDWVSGSKVEGAFLSGLAAAERIKEMIGDE
jgi:predicted NAD/FAD-dependent oxidoreductase